MKAVLGDLQLVVEQHSDILRSNALPFRILLGVRIVGFLLSFNNFAYVSLALTPIQLFSVEIWRIVTSAFMGSNLLLLSWTVFCLSIGTNFIRQCSPNEALMKTFVITQILTTAIVCLISFFVYMLTRSVKLLYLSNVVDMVAVDSAVFVMIKQFLPDSIVFGTPFGRVKYTHLPFCAIVSSIVLTCLDLCSGIVILEVLVAIQVSWTYLRFFQPHETDAIFGDQSDHFTWASLFPRVVQPACTIIGRICFRSLVKLGVCRRQVRHVDLESLQTVPLNIPVLDSNVKDAERRRKKALRDLNERLKKAKNMQTISWADDVDDDQNNENDDKKPSDEVVIESANKDIEVKDEVDLVESEAADQSTSQEGEPSLM